MEKTGGTEDMRKAVLIGAGQYGRGVIGMLLEQSGYHVLFADTNGSVIQDIQTRGEYTIRRIDRTDRSVTVKNISAINACSPELKKACAACDLLCTCTGLTAFPTIAKTIAESIILRRKNGFSPACNPHP